MTIQEWLDDFKTVAPQFKWKIVDGCMNSHKILGTHKDNQTFCGCPLTCYLFAKTGSALPDCSYRGVGTIFNISKYCCDDIANAADDIIQDGTGYGKWLRGELLQIVGLVETEK